jgi:hypothetical protein
MQPQDKPEERLATLLCTTDFISFSYHSKDPCRATYDEIELLRWKYDYTRTWKAGMSKKIIYRLNVWEIHVCHKTERNECQSLGSLFVYAESGHVCLKQHHADG